MANIIPGLSGVSWKSLLGILVISVSLATVSLAGAAPPRQDSDSASVESDGSSAAEEPVVDTNEEPSMKDRLKRNRPMKPATGCRTLTPGLVITL